LVERWVGWVWLDRPGEDETVSLIETNCSRVAAGDHKAKLGICEIQRPSLHVVEEACSEAGPAVTGCDPHGGYVGARRIVIVEIAGDDSAGCMAVPCDVTDGVGAAVPGVDALAPLGFGELRLFGVGASEGGWCVFEGAQTDGLEVGEQARREGLNGEHDWDSLAISFSAGPLFR
jgi:hypothetical protein